jgi:putative glutamine amidotransferase
LLNVMFGGTLYQDIPTQQPQALPHREAGRYEQHFHEIEILPGTRLAQLYPQLRRATTNSIHHQGIKTLAPGFEAEARCPQDGLIEAIRRRPDQGPAYVAAVQWHPEFHALDSPDNFDDRAMLQDFLAAARAARAERAAQPAAPTAPSTSAFSGKARGAA